LRRCLSTGLPLSIVGLILLSEDFLFFVRRAELKAPHKKLLSESNYRKEEDVCLSAVTGCRPGIPD